MLVHWIWFAHRPGLSDRMKMTLLQHFQDPEEIYFADSGAFDHVEGLTPEAVEVFQIKFWFRQRRSWNTVTGKRSIC